MGKYSEIVKGKSQSNEAAVQESAKVESNKTSEPENQKTGLEDMVNLSIKVPRRLRQKWVAESRLRGTTLTAIISDYLKIELGS
jgi:hypothetical protein